MPYLFLFLSLLLALPAAAAENELCHQCDTVQSKTENVVMPGTTGNWSIWRQNSSEQHCLRPAKAGQFYRIDGSFKTALEMERIYFKDSAITPDQATLALQHQDSIVLDTTKTAYAGLLYLTKKNVKSGIEYLIDEGNKVIMPVKNEIGSGTTDPLMLINLLAMFLLASFCAIARQGKKEIHNSVYFSVGGLFAIVSVTFLTIEGIALFQAVIATWPMKLLIANLGFSLLFLIMVIVTICEQHKSWLDPENRFDKKGTIRSCVIPLGFFYLAETIIFVGWRTNDWRAMLWYAGVAAIPFLIFNAAPATLEYAKKVHTSKKAKRALKKKIAQTLNCRQRRERPIKPV